MYGRLYRAHYFSDIYMLIFFIWYSTEIIFNTTLKSIFGVPIKTVSDMVNWLIFAMLMIQIIFFQSYKKRELVIIIGITLPIICTTVLSGSKSILSAWMFIVAAKNIDFDKVVHAAYRILLFMVPMIAFLCLTGFIEDNDRYMKWNMQRFSLGFLHPNNLGLRFFQLAVCHCYINKDKLRSSKYFFIIITIILTLAIPKSQTAYISLVVLLIMLMLYKYIQNRKHILNMFFKSLLIGTVLFYLLSVFLMFVNVNQYWILAKLDKWMSERFSYAHVAWLIYGISPFGQRVYITEAERKAVGINGLLYLDNAYASILLRYGIVVFFLFFFCYILLMKKMIQQKEGVLVIILFLYALYGVMENGLYLITHNIFLIAFSNLLYNKSKGKEENMDEGKTIDSMTAFKSSL